MAIYASAAWFGVANGHILDTMIAPPFIEDNVVSRFIQTTVSLIQHLRLFSKARLFEVTCRSMFKFI